MKFFDIDSMEESDDEYIPSSDEEDILVSHPPREKSIGKSHYPIIKSDVLDFNSSSITHLTKCIF